jgi:hypothetical protein
VTWSSLPDRCAAEQLQQDFGGERGRLVHQVLQLVLCGQAADGGQQRLGHAQAEQILVADLIEQ